MSGRTKDGNNASGIIERITHRGIPVRGDDIDTDRIIPARYLRCVTFEGIGDHAFEDDRKGEADAGAGHPFDQARFQGAGILVANANFGCGSSREHAPQSLWRWGIQGLIGESFAEIFFGNCVALGIPCVTATRDEVMALQTAIEASPETALTLDLVNLQVSTSDGSVQIPIDLPQGAREGFLKGTWDATSLLLAGADEVSAVAGKLPYVKGFSEV